MFLFWVRSLWWKNIWGRKILDVNCKQELICEICRITSTVDSNSVIYCWVFDLIRELTIWSNYMKLDVCSVFDNSLSHCEISDVQTQWGVHVTGVLCSCKMKGNHVSTYVSGRKSRTGGQLWRHSLHQGFSESDPGALLGPWRSAWGSFAKSGIVFHLILNSCEPPVNATFISTWRLTQSPDL